MPDPPLTSYSYRAAAALIFRTPGIQGLGPRARERKRRSFQIARAIDTPAGRRVLVATDESLGFGERLLATRALEPEVTLLEMRFDRDGRGTGKLPPAMKIAYHKETKIVELEDYASQPVRLSHIGSEDITRSLR